MNHALYRMVCDAECRYLTETEIAVFRDYAAGMEGRVETARKIEQREASLTHRATEAFFELPEGRTTEISREQLQRELSTLLRFVAAAHVRSDEVYFRRSYAEWVAGLHKKTGAARRAAASAHCLKSALGEAFDPFEARALDRYLDIYAEELGR